jgi:hypothetical protein
MKLPLSQANEQLRNFVEARIKEKAEEVCYYEFNLDHCTGEQSQTIELNGWHSNGKYEIEWVADAYFEIETSYNCGDYYQPPCFDVEKCEFINFKIKFISVSELTGEERYVEFEN